MPVVLSALVAVVLLLGGASLSVAAADQQRESQFEEVWVAAHTPTMVWTGLEDSAPPLRLAPQWSNFRVVAPQRGRRLYVWDPEIDGYAWVDARDVGPVDPRRGGTTDLPPIGVRTIYSGPGKITMYSCVELGGCGRTASGTYPRPGLVAVDRRLIPLGSKVWIEGMGTFLAADTGSAVRGAHVDVFTTHYREAVQFGIQRRAIVAFE